MDEQLAQIFVAAFGDADQSRFAAGGDLAWHQPEPSCKIVAAREGFTVVNHAISAVAFSTPMP
jgi:hypothetical protein